MSASKRVAVIGAGAAGLAAARELKREGHIVTVLEQGSGCGGVWQLDERVEDDDLLGQREGRRVVHSSMYTTLRTNLPREVMGFSDLPLIPAFMNGLSIDDRRFCGHEEVLRYLQHFAALHNLEELISYDTTVVDVRPEVSEGKQIRWHVSSVSSRAGPSDEVAGAVSGRGQPGSRSDDARSATACSSSPDAGGNCVDGHSAAKVSAAEYDAVVVCNGHFSEPRVPDIPGMSAFPGSCLHSHNYRRPEPFAGKRVLLVGARASGEDIALDLSPVARDVLLCARTWMYPDWTTSAEAYGPNANVSRCAMLASLEANGDALLEDGTRVEGVDVVMFCTGYKYRFPFLEAADIVDTSEQHVRPLYQHLLHPRYQGTLSFIGLPFKVAPFPQMEVQSLYVARLLSGRADTPSQGEMEAWIDDYDRFLKECCIPPRKYHAQGLSCWDYNDSLAERCGKDAPFAPAWRRAMFAEASDLRQRHPEDYREKWVRNDLLEDAYAEFNKLKQTSVIGVLDACV